MTARSYTAEQETLAPALGVPLGRVSYRVAGAAQRAACRRANLTPDLRVSDWRLLCAVLGLTTSYSKLCDFVSVGQLVEASGLSDRQVRRSLGRLRRAGLIVHLAGRGRGRLTLVGVPEADGKAATASASFLDGESGQLAGLLHDEERRPGSAAKGGQDDPEKEDEHARAVLTEKEPEKKYAEEQPSAARVDLPEELTRLLRDRFDLTHRQRREVLAAYREDRDGLARCVWRAIEGHNPNGLLTVLVREQAHREPGHDTFEEVVHLLDQIDGCDPPPTMPEADGSSEQEAVETIDGLTPDEWADYLYANHGDIFERPDERRRA